MGEEWPSGRAVVRSVRRSAFGCVGSPPARRCISASTDLAGDYTGLPEGMPEFDPTSLYLRLSCSSA